MRMHVICKRPHHFFTQKKEPSKIKKVYLYYQVITIVVNLFPKTLFKYLDWKIALVMCLTLGLAPFYPEPHLWGKLRWVAGGAIGMTGLDWFDLAYHGFPFVLLVLSLIYRNKTS